jgi:hypothetical protein
MLLDTARIRLRRTWGGSSGEVAEWSKANDSKSFEGQPSVGSNPTLSVSDLNTVIREVSRKVPPIPETHCSAMGFLLFGGRWRPSNNQASEKLWWCNWGLGSNQ